VSSYFIYVKTNPEWIAVTGITGLLDVAITSDGDHAGFNFGSNIKFTPLNATARSSNQTPDTTGHVVWEVKEKVSPALPLYTADGLGGGSSARGAGTGTIRYEKGSAYITVSSYELKNKINGDTYNFPVTVKNGGKAPGVDKTFNVPVLIRTSGFVPTSGVVMNTALLAEPGLSSMTIGGEGTIGTWTIPTNSSLYTTWPINAWVTGPITWYINEPLDAWNGMRPGITFSGTTLSVNRTSASSDKYWFSSYSSGAVSVGIRIQNAGPVTPNSSTLPRAPNSSLFEFASAFKVVVPNGPNF